MVPGAGLEPARPFGLEILSLLCLPFHHARRAITAADAGWPAARRVPRRYVEQARSSLRSLGTEESAARLLHGDLHYGNVLSDGTDWGQTAAAYRQLRNAPAVKMEQPAAASAEPDVLGQLEQLGKLRDAGVLTDAEFESKKAELLHRL